MQIHKKFTSEQVKFLLKGYCEGTLERPTIEEVLEINRSRFFELLSKCRHDHDYFSIAYQRVIPSRFPLRVENEIEKELMLEKSLVDDPTLPITTYNYSAIKDRLASRGIIVSLPTIIDRARGLGCYQTQLKRLSEN